MNLSNKNLLSQSCRAVLLPFLISRSLILLIFIFGTSAIFLEHQDKSLLRPQIRFSNLAESVSKLEKKVIIADAGWYKGIAAKGYSKASADFEGVQRNWAFFPLFPILWKCVSLLTGEFLLSGLFIANFFLFFALVVVHRVLLFQVSSETASFSIWLLCFFPTAYFLSLPFAESLFLLLIAVTALWIKQDKPFASAIAFALATGTRPTGLLLIPSFFLFLIENGYKPVQSFLLSALVAPIGLFAYSAYLNAIIGRPLAWMEIQKSWRSGGFPDLDFSNPIFLTDWNFVTLNISSAIICLCAGVYLLSKRQLAAASFVAVPILAGLWTGSTLSLSRHALTLFPIFPLLAAATLSRGLEKAILVLFCSGLAIMTLLFSLKATPAMT